MCFFLDIRLGHCIWSWWVGEGGGGRVRLCNDCFCHNFCLLIGDKKSIRDKLRPLESFLTSDVGNAILSRGAGRLVRLCPGVIHFTCNAGSVFYCRMIGSEMDAQTRG